MSVAPDLFTRLRHETSALHAEVERLVTLLGPRVTAADYREFLALLWGFHRPVEHLLGKVTGLDTVLSDWPRRQKANLLRADLAALGLAADELPVGQSWPALRTVDRALGCLYVVEGSTLGGQHIHRHLRAALPAVARDASRFLTCYGADCGRMWNGFRERVLRAEARLDQPALLSAAVETFRAVRDWFSAARTPRAAAAASAAALEGRAP